MWAAPLLLLLAAVACGAQTPREITIDPAWSRARPARR